MTETEVIDLMLSSINASEWNNNCDIVKTQCGGYPPFWYKAIVPSGVMQATSTSWR